MSQSYIKNLSRSRLVQTRISYLTLRTLATTGPLIIVPDPHPNQLLVPENAILDFKAGIAYADDIDLTLGWNGNGSIRAFDSVKDVDYIEYWHAMASHGTPWELTGDVGLGFSLTSANDRADGTGTVLLTVIYRVYTINPGF